MREMTQIFGVVFLKVCVIEHRNDAPVTIFLLFQLYNYNQSSSQVPQHNHKHLHFSLNTHKP
ncbi:hypothetical protein DNTS_008414, partial [Danionella cerebrum]